MTLARLQLSVDGRATACENGPDRCRRQVGQSGSTIHPASVLCKCLHGTCNDQARSRGFFVRGVLKYGSLSTTGPSVSARACRAGKTDRRETSDSRVSPGCGRNLATDTRYANSLLCSLRRADCATKLSIRFKCAYTKAHRPCKPQSACRRPYGLTLGMDALTSSA